jgi:hypothetical protein
MAAGFRQAAELGLRHARWRAVDNGDRALALVAGPAQERIRNVAGP